MLLVTLVVSGAICAQTPSSAPCTVKGILLDSLTLEAEPYATIKIVRKDAPDKVVKMAITGSNGKFEEKITEPGDYMLTITSIGKSTLVKEFRLASSERMKDLGTLYISDTANELQGVEVVAQKPLVKVDIDKIEYNVEDDPDAKTNSVLEMLRKVPLVTVDGEDKIQVNGSSSFKVHVNGKPNNMMSDNPTEVLKSMPANSIKNIEVITNPGAKYDAEGVGGILNIVTAGSGFDGYTATFSGNLNNKGAGGGVYATVKQDKFTLTGRYNYDYSDRPRSYSDSRRENNTGNTVLLTDGWSKNKGSFQHGSLEASYEVDTLRLITMSFGMYGGGNEGNGSTKTWFEDPSVSVAGPLYAYRALNRSESSWYSVRGNVDYQRSFGKKDRLLTLSYNINTRPQESDSYIKYEDKEGDQPYPLTDNRSDGGQNTTEHTFQVDYTTPVGKYHTVEGGVKYIIRDNVSDNDRYEQDILDKDRSSHYKHLNDILAAYSSYAIRYKAFSGRVGLRYERTMQDVKYRDKPEQNFKVDYNDVAPSASLGFKLGDTKNIRAGYQMRIWRPSIYFLNPYYDDRDPTNVRQGNPKLETEKSHSLNLSYSSFTAKFNLNVSLTHAFNNNAIEQVTELRSDGSNNYLYSTYENIGKSRSTGLSGYVNWNASPATRIYMNLYGSYRDMESPARKLRNSGWECFVYGGVQHTLPWELRLSLNVFGSTPPTSLQGRHNGFYDYSLALNRSFINKRLTISAFAGNFFKKYQTYTNETFDEAFTMKSSNYSPNRRFGVSISYRIGELKASVKKAARSINNDDEKGAGDSGGGESPS
jgi:hypothetical protein